MIDFELIEANREQHEVALKGRLYGVDACVPLRLTRARLTK